MQKAELKYFENLKRELVKTLQKSYAVSSLSMEEWKGQDITNLQDDLADKINQRISEKWFYTHLKYPAVKLPRIDMLNMLSQYTGHRDWADFMQQQGFRPSEKKPDTKSRKMSLWLIAAGLILVPVIYMFDSSEETYEFCFIDADRRDPVSNGPLEIVILNAGESPIYTRCDSNACFTVRTNEPVVKFVVRSPYYKTDTITRIIHEKDGSEMIRLVPNDYALMIHIFSTSKLDDWKKRRIQLDKMISDNAQIFQIFSDDRTGMELYNKWEFINKLTMPLASLKNIEIIETLYVGDKISTMRFRQVKSSKPPENE